MCIIHYNHSLVATYIVKDTSAISYKLVGFDVYIPYL